MSLLLDALNRASKDKAAVVASAVARAAEVDKSAPIEFTPSSPVSSAPAATSPPASWPTIGLSLAPSHPEPLLPAPHQPTPANATPPGDGGMTLVAEPQPPAPQLQKESKAEPLPAPIAAPATKQEAAPPPAPKSAPVDAPRAAQSILRAKTPNPAAGHPKRVIVLGSVAALLAAGLGSVMLGWWGDPMIWIQKNNQATTTLPTATMAPGLEPGASAAEVPQGAVSLPVRVLATVPPADPLPAGLRPPPAPQATPKPSRVDRSSAGCTPGLGLPDCKETSQTAAAVALVNNSKPQLQSRSNGPSALETGYAALTQGRLQDAAQAYALALNGNPEERDALLGLANIAHRQGRGDEARTYYQRVLRQEPGNPVAKAGLISLNPSDDAQELGSRSRDVAEQNPDSAAAQSLLAHNLVRQGRLADAQLLFYRALLLEPTVALHAFNLAVALDRLRNYSAALSYYELSLTLSNQAGGERASSVTHSVVQARLAELRSPAPASPAGSR